MTNDRPSNRPSHRLYAVPKKANGESGRWDEIGAAWPHKDGNGFNVKLTYLPLNGAELVLRIPKAKDETGEPTNETVIEGEF